MLQTASALNYQPLAARVVKPVRRPAIHSGTAINDLSVLYPESVLRSSDATGWQNVRAIHFRHAAREAVIPVSDDHCIVKNLGGTFFASVYHGKRRCEGEVLSSEIAIIPAGSSWVCQADADSSLDMLLLYLRPLFVHSAAVELNISHNEIGLTPQIGFKDKNICHVALSLLHELNDANVAGRLYADSLAPGLAIQLVRRYSALRDIHVGHGGMAPHKLRQAIALIDHHLSDEEEGRVALRGVARAVRMSYFHFSRAFKQSMGMTATNYIAERRIERAKKMLEETELPISEIALRSGFSSQSHFTTAFRRLAGATPKAFRAAL
ncbi:MAG TPA: helix-turn-helix transcriptional regulator [Pyrinomonadaceae bacterium]|nr:helix-turn-helix transcriptional regulator [Pyrinomonadaceae bacterium]